jgi:glycosyltransferase involved in cell wall biosynthesis
MHYHQLLVSREIGGAGVVALRLATEAKSRGLKSQIWVPGEGAALKEAAGLGLAAAPIDLAPAFSSSRIRAALANWRIGRRLRHFRPGLVHVHSPVFYGSLRWALRFSGLKRVVHVHLEEGAGFHWVFNDPPELIITCARFLVEHVRRGLPDLYQERQRIVAVPNAVDTERFYPAEKLAAKHHVGAPGTYPLIVMLANLAPHKGQETAIRAVAGLKQRGVDVHCWLAGVERNGEGSFTARLRCLIDELAVSDRVRLLGQRKDGPELLRAADFLLLPSTCEGLPLAILEAQATKVPVLAAPTAGIPEVIQDGVTGFLIAADDASTYAVRIAELLANPGLYHSIAERAYARTIREHNWNTYSSRILELYHEVMVDGATTKAPCPESGAVG